MNRMLERILPNVQKPARYTGGEYNAVVKKRSQVDTRFALCFLIPTRSVCPIWAAGFCMA